MRSATTFAGGGGGGGETMIMPQPPLLGYFFSRSNIPRAIRQPPRIRV